MALLVGVAGAGILGTVVVQGHPPEVYRERFGALLGEALVWAGIDDVFHAPWFLGLLGLLGVNVAWCASRRLRLGALPLLSTLTHAAVIVVLAGGLLDLAFGADGYVKLARGESVTDYEDARGQRRALGFRLELSDFRVEEDERLHRVVGFGSRNPSLERVVVLGSARRYDLGGGFSFRILRDLAEFSHAEGVDAEVRAIAALRGPALLVALSFPDGREERRWLFGANPGLDVNSHADPAIRLAYRTTPAVRDFVSVLAVHGTTPAGETPEALGEARVNAPFAHGGMIFTPFGHDERARSWSLLRVTREPGTPLVFAGLVLLMVGVTGRVGLSLHRSGKIGRG